MRIERIELDGFGRFADRRWELGEGLTVLLGENEAGKTTLLNAIRALLFGFESTREGRAWYPALAGGRRGGRLTLLTAGDERWSVERHGERGGVGALSVTAPNGNQGGQETLDRVLGGADRDLFNNIFAFGLGELEAFSSLSGEGVRSRIYGAGSGLGGTSALDLERRLRAEQEAAYKPRGREQTVNHLLSTIEELRARIAQLEEQPAEYAVARSDLAEVRQHHAVLRADRIAAVERRERLKRLLDAQAPAAQLAALESELAEGDTRADGLPADAEALLDRTLAAAREAAAALAALDESIEGAERRLVGAPIDDRLLADAAEIGALRDERLIHEQRAAQRQQAEASATRFTAELDDQLRRVGGWSEERLLAMDDSIATVEATRAADQRLSVTRAAAERIGQRLESIHGELAAAEPEGDGTALLDEHELAARRSIVAELGELRARQAALDERARVLSELPAAAQPRWLLPVAAAALVLLLGVVAGAALGAVSVGAVAGLLLGLVAAGIWWRRPSGALPPSAANDDLRHLAEHRAFLLERLGLRADAPAAAIGDMADELAAAQAGARQGRDRSARLAERRAALKRLESDSAEAERVRTDADDGWRAWLVQRQLPDELTPEAVRQMLAAVGIGRRAATERDEQLGRRATIDEAAAAFDARLDALLERLGRPRPDSPAMRPAAVVALAESLQQAAADQRQADELTATLADARRRRTPLAEADAAAREALAAHLASCGATDPDRLRLMAKVAADRRELRGRVRETHAALAGIAGSGEAVAAVLEEAQAHGPAALEAQRDEAAGEASRVEAAESEALTREGALQARIDQLEKAGELGERRQELAIAQAQADAEARRWSVRAVALALLGETRRRYERERQPRVVQDAQSYFATITDGRYPRIVAPTGEAAVRVEPESGSPRTTDELSRGTAEQLYLALRFGLIEQFGRSADPLPVVMDDILVNFDPGRAARAARAIGQLAARHQVVFFTCHPAAAELLDPDGVVTQRLD